MDLQSTVTAFPGATPIDGLDRAWTWLRNPAEFGDFVTQLARGNAGG